MVARVPKLECIELNGAVEGGFEDGLLNKGLFFIGSMYDIFTYIWLIFMVFM